MKNLLIAAVASAVALSIAPAYAASSSEQISLCSAALEAQGIAPADIFKKKFVNIKGAALKTVTFKLTPLAGGDAQVAECQIKGSKVVGAAIKA
jgi:hypothetical protein